MIKKTTNLMLAMALTIVVTQTARAQWVHVAPIPNSGGKHIIVVLDDGRANELVVSVEPKNIVIDMNGEYHNVPINKFVPNLLRIVDGNYGSDIQIVGLTPPAGLDIGIWGQGGDDWIANHIGHPYGTPASTIYGGDGDDQIWAGPGADSVYGGSGDDEIFGGTGPDHLEGGNGNDLLLGEGDDDVMFGGAGADKLDGGAGDDDLYGNRYRENIDGETDLLIGGLGRDRFYNAYFRRSVSSLGGSKKSYIEYETVDDFNRFLDARIETQIRWRYGIVR